MKKIYLLLLVFLPLFSTAQITEQFDTVKSGCMFLELIDVEGKSAQDLFLMANLWFSEVYDNPNKVIEEKIENKSIKGNALGSKVITVSKSPLLINDLKYSIRIDVKDGKVRFLVRDMIVKDAMKDMTIESYLYKEDNTLKEGKQAEMVRESLRLEINRIYAALQKIVLEQGDPDDQW